MTDNRVAGFRRRLTAAPDPQRSLSEGWFEEFREMVEKDDVAGSLTVTKITS
ncbi:MAG: hypothetical protein GQ565_13710 [Candidatus Aegiribacteria sp.]|nr:hypothetical protein [Candidatus Aegiribacteria sp.]